jgi:integrase
LADARRAALETRHAIDLEGRDPAAERREPEPATEPIFTFADLVTLYEPFAHGRKRTAHEDMQKIRKYLLPAWGNRPLRSITRADVHTLLDRLVAKGLTVGVNRVQSVASRLFTLALDRSLVDAHPAARMIKRFKESPSTRTLTDDELRSLWRGLDERPGRAADFVRLRLLLGQRGAEIARMRWSDLDLDGGLWTLPAATAKNGRPHSVPLPDTSVALLKRRREGLPVDESRVFPRF